MGHAVRHGREWAAQGGPYTVQIATEADLPAFITWHNPIEIKFRGRTLCTQNAGARRDGCVTIFTVLIAMEFKHSIIKATLRRDGIVQVRTVVLIALLAMSRKFVILDSGSTSAATICALAAVTLVLGAVYWLLKDQSPLE